MKQGWISIIMTIFLMLISLIFVKLQVSILGIEIYGILTLLLSVFGTINLMNFGFGSALVKLFTIQKNRTLYWGMFIILSFFFILFSLIILLLISPFYKEIYSFIGIEGEKNLNIFSFFGVGVIGLSRLLGTVISSYWQAKINFFKLKLFNFINTYLSIFFIILLFYFKLNLNHILLLTGTINILFVISVGFFILFKNSYNLSVVRFVTYEDLRSLFRDSNEFFLIQISNNLLNPLINIGLARSIGIEAVSLFDIANKFLRAGRQIIVSYSEPFFGLSTKLINEKKYGRLKRELLKNSKIMIGFSIAYIIVGFFSSNYLISLWVGSNIAYELDYVVKIILVGFGVNISTSIIYYYLLAEKDYRKYVMIHQFIQLIILSLIFVIPLGSLNDFAKLFSLAFFTSGIYIIYTYILKKNDFIIQKK